MFDATFWSLIGLVLFFLLILYLKVPGKLLSVLDDHARKVHAELDEAKRLREEAQDVLAAYKRKLEDADQDVEKIITRAKRTAEEMIKEAEIKSEEQLARKEAQMQRRIAQAEAEAVSEIRRMAVDAAVDAVEAIALSQIKPATANRAVNESIAEVGQSI